MPQDLFLIQGWDVAKLNLDGMTYADLNHLAGITVALDVKPLPSFFMFDIAVAWGSLGSSGHDLRRNFVSVSRRLHLLTVTTVKLSLVYCIMQLFFLCVLCMLHAACSFQLLPLLCYIILYFFVWNSNSINTYLHNVFHMLFARKWMEWPCRWLYLVLRGCRVVSFSHRGPFVEFEELPQTSLTWRMGNG